MPYEGRPGAYWAMLGPDVELRSTAYDLDAAGGGDPRHRLPGCRRARRHAAEPPTSDEVARHFESLATG